MVYVIKAKYKVTKIYLIKEKYKLLSVFWDTAIHVIKTDVLIKIKTDVLIMLSKRGIL